MCTEKSYLMSDGAPMREGRYVERTWIPADGAGLPRREKQGGAYRAYVPVPLRDMTLRVPAGLSEYAARTEREILAIHTPRSGGDHGEAGQLESIARLLMRSEVVSSSRIEGIAPNVDKVILAELAQEEEVRGFKDSAESVARNLTVMRSVEERFTSCESVTVELLEGLQADLLDGVSIPKGVRTIQNWIGGNNFNPIGADFVPPPPEHVRPLVKDLCEYMNGATHGALIQAAVVHAQFETIHPFADGNGRVGRALIHGVLQRRGLTRGTVLPISLVLGTWSDRYVRGLTAYRNLNSEEWLAVFVDAAHEAVRQAHMVADSLAELGETWVTVLGDYRERVGRRRAVRSDSLEATLLHGLFAHPIVTARTVERIYGVKQTNGRKALETLADAGILRKKVIGKRGLTGYFADDVLDLITHADRRLASSQFDTRLAPPAGRGVPRLLSRK